MTHRLRRFARVLLVAVPSFMAGALLTAYLAADASRLFFSMLRDRYGSEEEIAAVCAQHRGDVHEAVRHYANAVSAYAADAWWQTRAKEDDLWPLAFPLAAILLREPAEWSTVLPRIEALDRVRLANALKEEGQTVRATRQLDRAARLLGPNGESQVEAALRENLDESPLLAFCRSSSTP